MKFLMSFFPKDVHFIMESTSRLFSQEIIGESFDFDAMSLYSLHAWKYVGENQ